MWNKTTFGIVNHQIKLATKEIESSAKRQHTNNNLEALKYGKRNLNELLQRQEIIWRQKSKVEWLTEGDLNTTFFLGRATARKEKNLITRVKKEVGEWVHGDEKIEKVAK